MQINGIPISKNTARLMYLPISHLMKHTLMACPLDEIDNAEFRAEYAEDIWGPEKAARYNERLAEWSRLGISYLSQSWRPRTASTTLRRPKPRPE